MKKDDEPPHISLQISGFAKCVEAVPSLSSPPLGGTRLAGSRHSGPFLCYTGASLVGAAAMAYVLHYPLTLTPGAIWLTIVSDLARHLTREEDLSVLAYRESFKTLSLHTELTESTLLESAGLASKKLDPISREFLCCNDLVHGRQALGLATRLAFLQRDNEPVFSDEPAYVADWTTDSVWPQGGIPKLELRGWRDDWEFLTHKISLLKQWGLSSWMASLQWLTSGLLDSLNGHPDRFFLQDLFQVCPRMAPLPRFRGFTVCGNHWVSGWIGCLYNSVGGRENYLLQGPYREVSPEDYLAWKEMYFQGSRLQLCAPSYAAHSFASALGGVVLDENEQGRRVLVGGLLGFQQNQSSKSLEPVPGWAVLLQKRPATDAFLASKNDDDAFNNLDCLPKSSRWFTG